MIYWLSAGDEITATSDDWNEFAAQNDGAGAMADVVTGRPLWDFVQGVPTRRFLSNLFLAARTSILPLSLPYRCDGLGEDRLFGLRVVPEGRGVLRLEHRTLRRRPAFAGTLPKAGIAAAYRQCSICLSCHAGQHWIAPGRLLRSDETRVTWVVCPACEAALCPAALSVIDALIPS